jgi:hypothetical protein
VKVDSFGQCIPSNVKKASGYGNVGLYSYGDFTEDFLRTTMSINSRGSIPYNDTYPITADTAVPGFGYAYPGYSPAIATTASNVIGLPYFTTFANFSQAIITKSNVAYVVANLSDTGADFDGIWQGNNPNIQPVVILGDPAPDEGVFTTFGGQIGVSRNGKYVAFSANTTRSGNAVFRADKGGKNILTVVKLGAEVPNGEGATGRLSSVTLAAANDKGQIAIRGTVSTSTGNRDAIWVTDGTGKNLKLVVIQGQAIPGKSGLNLVRTIDFNPLAGLNAKGELAFTATFGDRKAAVIVAK